MNISQKMLDLIKGFEGFRSKPYLCPAGVTTIGYGTTVYPDGRKVTFDDDPIDEHVAEKLLLHDVSESARIVSRNVEVDLTQNEFDAMVSIVYNVGPGIKFKRDGIVWLRSGKNSTLLTFLNKGEKAKAAEQFERWVFGGGVKLAGLEKRRKIEREVFEGKR